MLAIDEELCDMERVRDFHTVAARARTNALALLDLFLATPGSFWSLLEDGGGVWGRPSESTAEKGEEFLAWATRAVVNLVRDMDDVHDQLGPATSARGGLGVPHAELGERRIFYEEHGSGDPVLLVSGLGADHAAWALQTESLQESFRVIVFDNPGVGQTEGPRGPSRPPSSPTSPPRCSDTSRSSERTSSEPRWAG